jgi:hypothetical protein
MKDNKKLKKAFGVNEYEFAEISIKISNVKISRFKNYKKMGGCPFSFPHGVDCTNGTVHKKFKSWKHFRNHQYNDGIIKNYKGTKLKNKRWYK